MEFFYGEPEPETITQKTCETIDITSTLPSRRSGSFSVGGLDIGFFATSEKFNGCLAQNLYIYVMDGPNLR